MQPRLKYSSKWTPLPAELTQQIQDLFTENFSTYANEGHFFVEGRIYLKEVLLGVGYRPHQQLKQTNFEISIEYNRNKDNMLQMIHLAVDCAASLMDQYFTAENPDFPVSWQSVDFMDRPIYWQYTSVNTELEAQADRLLGENTEEGLMQGEDEEEDLAVKISMLGLADEDFPNQTRPAQNPGKSAPQGTKETKSRSPTTKKKTH